MVRTCMTSRARVFMWEYVRPGSRDYKIGKLHASWYKLVIRHGHAGNFFLGQVIFQSWVCSIVNGSHGSLAKKRTTMAKIEGVGKGSPHIGRKLTNGTQMLQNRRFGVSFNIKELRYFRGTFYMKIPTTGLCRVT